MTEFGNRSNIDIANIIIKENDNENVINSPILLILKNIKMHPNNVDIPAIKDKNKGPIISIVII